MAHRTTLLDVAREAQVSRATASRVLAGTQRRVDPELVARVHRAAHDLGYRIDPVARALRTGSTGTMGLLVPAIRHPYFATLIEAFTQAADDRGLAVLLAESQHDPAIEAERIERLLGARVDGIAVVPASFDRSGATLAAARRRTPLVQVDRWALGAQSPAVAMDNAAAIGLLVQHLRATGRRRLTFIGAEPASSAGTERVAAFRALATTRDDLLLLPRLDPDAGRQAGDLLLRARTLPDAVLCSADTLAVGVSATLHRAGVDIPGRVALTGFDDTDLLECGVPPITTIHHPLPEIVGRVLDLLGDREVALPGADSPGPTTHHTQRLAPRLVVRESTAPS